MYRAPEKQFVKMATKNVQECSFCRSCCANRPSRKPFIRRRNSEGKLLAQIAVSARAKLFPKFIRVQFASGTNIKINVQSRWRRSGVKRGRKGSREPPDLHAKLWRWSSSKHIEIAITGRFTARFNGESYEDRAARVLL